MKNKLRQYFLNIRKNFTKDYVYDQSSKVVEQIRKDSTFLTCQKIGIYYPTNNELDILSLVKSFPQKDFYLPRIIGEEMIFVKYNSNSKLEKNKFNIPEPIEEKEEIPELIFTPIICSNFKNDRIGYGGGYYDKYLRKYSRVKKIGINYIDLQYSFEKEKQDITLDKILFPEIFNKSLVLLASGKGERAGFKTPKCLVKVFDKYLFEYSLFKFSNKFFKIVVLPENNFFDVTKYQGMLYLTGGSTRSKSLINAIPYIKGNYTYIHDGARPNLSLNSILELEKQENENLDGYYLAKKPVNAIKDEKNNNIKNLIIAETPQVVKSKLLTNLLKNELIELNYRDDIELVMKNYKNLNIKPCFHKDNNFKITYENDLLDFKKQFNTKYLVGHSFDIHKIVKNKKLYLGGVLLSEKFGLKGNSDGDALIHSLVEAIFGALGQRDLGHHFPEEDLKYKGIRSLHFLEYAKNLLDIKNYCIINLDILVYYDGIKLNNYFPKILDYLKETLNLENISIKATTTEKLGKIKNNQAIACETNLLIGEKNDN